MFQPSPAFFDRRSQLAALAFAILAFAAASSARGRVHAGQKAEIESIIKDYLLAKPEILRDALTELDAREKLAETKAASNCRKSVRPALQRAIKP